MAIELKLVLKLFLAIAGAIIAWEMKGRLKRRNEKLDVELLDGFMQTSMVSLDGEKAIKHVAAVQYHNNLYRLTITSDANGKDRVFVQEDFGSREELEKFLNENTNFRLGDFVRR